MTASTGPGVTRLTVLAHQVTGATLAQRFPLPADRLAPAGRGALARAGKAGSSGGAAATTAGPDDLVVCAPELRARETCYAVRVPDRVDPAFADIDPGDWAGRPLTDLAPDELAPWLTDPGFGPPGGESLSTARARIAAALDALVGAAPRVVLVAHPATVRVAVVHALGAPDAAFWRIDAGPGTTARLHHRAGRWTLRLGEPSSG